MISLALITAALLLAPPEGPGRSDGSDGLLAIRVGRAETASHGTIEHAVLLIEKGKIVAIGQDLSIERGIPVLDRPDWVATPGFVHCATRIGLDSRSGNGFEPQQKASGELYARQDVWAEVLEHGFTTLGLQPPGGGIPGQSAAIRPRGKSAAEMILQDPANLSITLSSNAGSKKMLRGAFEKVDEHDEKVKKEREKWDKEREKKKPKSKKDEEKKEGEAEGEKKEKVEEGPKFFVPPAPDAKVVPFIALREKKLSALITIGSASDYLHLLDVISEEEFDWSLACDLRNDIDLWEITARVGETGRRIVLSSEVTLQEGTRRERNLPAEFQRAGAKVALVPNADRVDSFENWRLDVGFLVAAGLDRDTALRAMTLEPAEVLGLGARLGSLDVGKDANILLWNGDPFEPRSELQAILLEGDIVKGDVHR